MEIEFGSLLKKHKLSAYQSMCEKLITAYQGYPQLSECDRPENQLVRFLVRCDGFDASEIDIRFKHQISELDVFQLRAFKISGTHAAYFDPFIETYSEFSKNSEVDFYSNLHPFPPIDIVLKRLQSNL